jgi:Tfp pilus assembly protein PilX
MKQSTYIPYTDQQGFVSIVVSLIIMVILSLVTIGFAQIMSREQRQALDRQLSTQAFYAAESGVNDARNVKLQGYSDTCGSSAKVIDTVSQSVHETCVFVNEKPKTIKYDNVDKGPKVFPVHTVDSSGTRVTPDTIVVKWSKASSVYGSDFRAAGNTAFDTNAAWGANTGLGRLYIIPFNAGDTRDTILQNTSFTLLNPVSGGINSQTLAGSRGNNFGTITDGNCSGASCSVTITGFAASYSDLYISLSSLYMPNNYEVSASKGGAALSFVDVQAVIDSTGRNTDVLRRIETRVPLIEQHNYPVAALNGDICKLWTVMPTSVTPPATSTNDSTRCP